jgi:hypothetical protein
VVSEPFLGSKSHIYFSLCRFLKGKRGIQHLDPFLKHSIWNPNKEIVSLISPWKNSQVIFFYPKWNMESEYITNLK